MSGESTWARRLAATCLPALLFLTGCPPSTPEKSKTGAVNPAAIRSDESGFVPLTLADFERFAGKPRQGEALESGQTWSEKDGVISCTGHPRGYIFTKKPFHNFELRFEYWFPKTKGAELETLNTGCLIYIQGPHRVWPKCLEVQGKWLDMGTIKSNARTVAVETLDEQNVRREFRYEPGNWNAVAIQSIDGALLVRLNGKVVCSSKPTVLKEGRIGFQSEGSPVRFRHIRIRVPQTPAAR